MDEVILTPEQEAEAERIEDIVRAGAAAEIRAVARLLASKENRHLLGSDGVPDSRRDTSHWSPSSGRRSFRAKKRGTKDLS